MLGSCERRQEGKGRPRGELRFVKEERRRRFNEGTTHHFSDEQLEILVVYDGDVSVEKRGGELEEGERHSGGLNEGRWIAEAKDLPLELDGEGGRKMIRWRDEGRWSVLNEPDGGGRRREMGGGGGREVEMGAR